MWLIGTSLAKTGGFYKEIYKKWKNFYWARNTMCYKKNFKIIFSTFLPGLP